MLKHEFRCEICHSKFDSNMNIPKVLLCGHTICSKCVDRMREKNINRCPFDRKIIDYDEDKVPNNFYILSLIDGSIKESTMLKYEEEKEEEFVLTPKTVVNNPGWKNTLGGFIKGNILYTVESNGFIYCTDLQTGEWWFLYLSQFWGNHFFMNNENQRMYLIDQNGSLFQVFNKNYYTQVGRKNSWKNTLHTCVFDNKMYTIESSNRLYETNLESGKWKEVGARKIEDNIEEEANLLDNQSDEENEENNRSNEENSSNNTLFEMSIGGFNLRIPNIFNTLNNLAARNRLVNNANNIDSNEEDVSDYLKKNTKPVKDNYFNIKDPVMMVALNNMVLVSNKNCELFKLETETGETELIKSDFNGNILSYSHNSSHIYFVEKNGRVIYRTVISESEDTKIEMSSYIKEINLNTDIQSISQEFSNIEIKSEPVSRKASNAENNNKSTKKTPKKSFKISTEDDNSLFSTQKFCELDEGYSPLRVVVSDSTLAIIDKKGDLLVLDITTKQIKSFQCLFMLRNCHLQNSIIIGDGDLVILDPIRLSLNKLNIVTGSEVIMLHSLKFLSTIKHIFSTSSKLYFIDTAGNLYYFIENEKKISQIGSSGICKYVVDLAVWKNFLFSIENNILYRTNLSDGSFIEIKNEFCSNYKYFFSDYVNLLFIDKEDNIIIVSPGETLKFKKKISFPNISKKSPITYFKGNIIYYNSENNSIEGIDVEKDMDDNNVKYEINSKMITNDEKLNENSLSVKILVDNFPDVLMFINNNDCLACILRNGVIYKLFC